MEKDFNWKRIDYVFNVQSPEDFYNQLRAFHREDWKQEQEIDVMDLSLAQDMLRGIGVNV